MSKILYYSNFCNSCKKLLQDLAKNQEKDNIHFLCIDKRIKKENGNIYILLENNQEILLPSHINRVPALLFLNTKETIFGDDINNKLQLIENTFSNKIDVIKNQSEPTAFSFNGMNSGVVSDNFSFWDQDSDALSAKGNGGLRQLYNYSTIEQQESIYTPEENYQADKIGNISIEKLQQQRNESLKK